MKSYKSFQKVFIGDSDIASLVIRTPEKVDTLYFGSDGAYYAYICEGKNVEIGEHYTLVFEGDTWLKIYDDEGLTLNLTRYGSKMNRFKIYRAGDFGCIIHIFGESDTPDYISELKAWEDESRFHVYNYEEAVAYLNEDNDENLTFEERFEVKEDKDATYIEAICEGRGWCDSKMFSTTGWHRGMLDCINAALEFAYPDHHYRMNDDGEIVEFR